MNVVKKMDDIGRIVIPQNLRRALRWMGGDEIEIIINNDDSITLRKYENDTASRLQAMSLEWSNDIDIQEQFNELIKLIESKTGSN